MKLLQVPTMELEQRIKEEIEENPALEEGKEEREDDDEYDEAYDQEVSESEENFDINDYINPLAIIGQATVTQAPTQNAIAVSMIIQAIIVCGLMAYGAWRLTPSLWDRTPTGRPRSSARGLGHRPVASVRRQPGRHRASARRQSQASG